MRRFPLAALLAATLLGLATIPALAQPYAPPPGYYDRGRPPPMRMEPRPAAPYGWYRPVWVPGRWVWTGYQWAWRPGHWRR